jgi:pimeloyl-ACP methyl ester carboxylesterase
MRTERKILFLSFLACGIIFSANVSCASGPTYVPPTISTSTIWTKENSPYVLNYKTTVSAKLTIEPGVVVKFASSATGIEAQAEISAVGKDEEKIVFTSIHDDSVGGDTDISNERSPQPADWDKINVSPNFPARFENVVLQYGTSAIKSSSSGTEYENLAVKNSEIKNNYIGIDIQNIAPSIERNLITHNTYGISAQNSAGFEDRVATVRSNVISGNDLGIGTNNHGFVFNQPTVDARYNWWGDESGPKVVTKNPKARGDGITDNWVSFEPWILMDPREGPDPVVVIPGILGSWKVNGVWTIDPIFHTYDNLRDEFLANGYRDGVRFFTFPYEWRDSNVANAKLLAKKIGNIKRDTGRPKVDIVAHSMGGLLARQYIESDEYGGDVDQLITVGTPQLGAPKDYVKWEAGEAFFDMVDMAAKRLIALESIENGYLNTVNYIQAKIPSVQELLPTYNYLYDVKNNFALRASYPNNYPRNEFLEVLNSSDKIQRLKNVEFTKIIGRNNDNASTISGYNVINYDVPGIWENGFPKYFNIPYFNDQGIVASDGDKTVPLYSAESLDIPADKTMYFPSEHGALPTDAQKDILEILTGKRPTNEITKFHVPNLLLLLVHSPIDIQVESPSGKKIGKNFDTDGAYNQIEGAYYSGFDTKSEFITIPDPEDGEYKITAQGTDEGGKYAIEVVKITENPENPDNAKESSATIEGNAQPGDLKNDKIFLQQDRVTNNIDNTPPTISISSPKKMDYTNDKILAIDIDAEDAESGVVSVDWQVEKDGQKLDWQEKSVDLSLESLGNYSLAAIATDKAGNSKKETMDFRVTTNLEAIQNNLDHYWELKLVKNKVAKEYFDLRLKDLEKLFNSLKQTQDSKLKPLPKKIAVEAIKKIINADINLLESQINRKSPQWIDPKAADLLVEDLNAIKIK